MNYSTIAIILLNCVYLVTSIKLIGGEIDKYGCNPSAGYNYCNYTHSCHRFNEPCAIIY